MTVVQFGPAVSLEYLKEAKEDTAGINPDFGSETLGDFSLEEKTKTGFGDFDFHSFDGLV